MKRLFSNPGGVFRSAKRRTVKFVRRNPKTAAFASLVASSVAMGYMGVAIPPVLQPFVEEGIRYYVGSGAGRLSAHMMDQNARRGRRYRTHVYNRAADNFNHII